MSDFPGFQEQPYMPAPQTPLPPVKKSRKRLWITLGVLAGVLVLACAGIGGLVVYAIAQAAKPVEAAQTFCNDLKAQDYTAAYTLLSTHYQTGVNSDQFVQASKLHDQIDGPVQSCGPQTGSGSNFSLNFNSNTATLAVQVRRTKPLSGQLALVTQGSAWKIDSIAPSLQGTDIGPLVVAGTFCKALAAGDYQTAWNETSAGFQSQAGSEADYAASIQQALQQSSATIAGCQPTLASYTVAASDASASLSSALLVTVGGTTVPSPEQVTFVKTNGVWQLDTLVSTASGS